jgi:hypothetical protein
MRTSTGIILPSSSSSNKIFIEQPSSEPEVRVIIPMYEPSKIVKCKKCGKTITQPKELIKIVKSDNDEEIVEQGRTRSIFIW